MRGRLWQFLDRDTSVPGDIQLVEHPELSTTADPDGTFELVLEGVEDGEDITPRFLGGTLGETEYEPSSQRTFTVDGDIDCAYYQAVASPVFGLLVTLLEDAQLEVDPEACHVVTTIQDATVTTACQWDEYKAHDPHGVAGILATLEGSPGDPVYFNEEVFPDPSLDATSIDGGVLWLNLPVGESYTVTAQDPSGAMSFEPLTVTCHEAGLVNATPPWGLRPI
ncbi:MAG: hypothetical protein GY913_16645 [Proteobacteria bacterium]|nr:hypothetical protein [Pseudomonadota bacterium]